MRLKASLLTASLLLAALACAKPTGADTTRDAQPSQTPAAQTTPAPRV